MEWQLIYGDMAPKILAAARDTGAPLPKAFRNAPFLVDSYHHRVLDAFWQLSTCRQIGMGTIGPIPWDSTDRYATKNGFASTDIEYDSFIHIIQSLDSAFMEHQANKIRENAPPKGGAQSGKPGGIRSPTPRGRGKRSKRGR